ncbi:MAG TPA: hypothetical protein VFV41_27235 [Streptosporangiaceae bacterium]|nr:hypothetical protein [Streptosporangiaceae bacterium]
MADDQHGSPGEQPTRPLPAMRGPLPGPPSAGPPLVDPLTFGGPLIPGDLEPADPPHGAGPEITATAAAPGRPPPSAVRPAAAATRAVPPPAADPAAVTARRHGAVTRSPSGTPPPAVSGPPAAGPPDQQLPAGRPGSRPRRQLQLPASLLAACAVLIAAAVVVTGVREAAGKHHGRRGGAAVQAAAAARGQAARWVAREVSRSAVVACSIRRCGALRAAGLPAARLLVLGAGAADPAGAGVVVATPDLRARLGARLTAGYAPLALARFGSGGSQIAIRVVAPGGSAAYLAALRRDREARRHAGARLLASRRLQVSAQARAALARGQVDARLLLLLPALAAARPVRVLAFGGTGPRADPQLPLGLARLAARAGPAGAGYALWLRGYLRQQHAPYLARARIWQAPGGTVVTIALPAPGPLGLLHGG